jgi:hypothetical protein
MTTPPDELTPLGNASTPVPAILPGHKAFVTITGTGTAMDGLSVPVGVLIDPATGLLVSAAPWTPVYQANLSNVPSLVIAGAATVGGWAFTSSNNVLVYVGLYDALPANVTVGTTVPTIVFGVPSTGHNTMLSAHGIKFTTAVTAAALADRQGGTAPNSPLACSYFVRLGAE